jgi:hypothetical protein
MIGTVFPDSSQGYSSSIIEARLNLCQTDESTNCLSISFFSHLEEGDAEDPVRFYLEPLIEHAGSSSSSSSQDLHDSLTIADVYPLNGVSKNRKFKITDFVQPKHRMEISQSIELVNQQDPEKQWVRCLVIDFKDVSGCYDDLDKIRQTEREFSAFFQGDVPGGAETQKSIYRLIHDNQISFFINEGSLKAKLIRKAFSPEQRTFLQDTTPGQGPALLCQLCEIIMNTFKKGCKVTVNGRTFRPEKYITPISEHLIKRLDSTERGFPFVRDLVTYYPHHYREMYSDSGEYFQLITKLFEANHGYDDVTQTTAISIR